MDCWIIELLDYFDSQLPHANTAISHPANQMINRRSFVSRLSVALSALWVPPFDLIGRPPLALQLFFDHERLEILRDRFKNDPLFAHLKQELDEFDRKTEWQFVQNDVIYNDHLYHVARLSRTAEKMAFYYVMTANEDAGMLAAECIRQLMRFPKWDYFLEAGEQVIGIQRASAASVAVSLCSDWLGDLIPDEERDTWLRTMGKKGCEPCFLSIFGMRYPDRVVGWTMDPTSTYFEHRPNDRVDLSNWPIILDRTNLKAVPASALAIAAITYEMHFGPSSDTERWIEQAVFSLATFRDLYARDGSYDENLSYADYTSLHIAQATHLLADKKEIDLYDHINWAGLMEFVINMTMPTSDDINTIVNFGDAGNSLFSAVPFWIAGHSHDAQAQWFGLNRSRGHNQWSLLWYKPDASVQTPPSTPYIYLSDLDWIVGRTGFEPEDLVVAMRSGGPANHEHADRNSIIVKCYGEQLVADPYRPPYSFADPAWMMRTTAGHSALLIDNEGHQYHDGAEGTNPSDAHARIVRKMERDDYLLWASDATPAYQLALPDVESVTRTVILLLRTPAVIVVDKVIKKTTPSRLQARFFAFNMDGKGEAIASGEDSFSIQRPLAYLKGRGISRLNPIAESLKLPIPEETAAKHPFVQVSTQEASKTPLLITVMTPVQNGDNAPNIPWQENDGAHRITVGTQQVTVYDKGSLPEIQVG